ncbi:MAG: hypothetical protein AMXMBFR84_49500 [Candidatus Hydrogenedentota bacterium]
MYTPSERQLDQNSKAYKYHAPKDGQPERYTRIRDEFGKLAHLLITNCPESRELSVALTNLEQANMWANAAIARNE